ncbi:hypothetical protein VRRI112168_08995 [Vreelandella rituensis]
MNNKKSGKKMGNESQIENVEGRDNHVSCSEMAHYAPIAKGGVL